MVDIDSVTVFEQMMKGFTYRIDFPTKYLVLHKGSGVVQNNCAWMIKILLSTMYYKASFNKCFPEISVQSPGYDMTCTFGSRATA